MFLEDWSLARYWLVPVVVTFSALITSMVLVVRYHGAVVDLVWTDPAGEDWLSVLGRVAHVLFEIVVVVLLGVVAIVVTTMVGNFVAAPFNARLGETLDARVTGHAAPPFALGRVVTDFLRASAIEVAFFVVNAVLFVASFALPVASPVLGALGFIFGAYCFALAYLEIPLAARDATLRDRWALVRAHPAAVLGFGLGVGAVLFVPVVNVLFMPAAVAGGVLLHADLALGTRSAAGS